MKKQDFLFIILVVVVFLPFFLSDAVYDWYKSFNAEHGMVMSFLKFAILSSLGEVLGLRISAGVYKPERLWYYSAHGGMGHTWYGYQCRYDYLFKRCAAVHGVYGNGKCCRNVYK